jgi:hypothetical protein
VQAVVVDEDLADVVVLDHVAVAGAQALVGRLDVRVAAGTVGSVALSTASMPMTPFAPPLSPMMGAGATVAGDGSAPERGLAGDGSGLGSPARMAVPSARALAETLAVSGLAACAARTAAAEGFPPGPSLNEAVLGVTVGR